MLHLAIFFILLNRINRSITVRTKTLLCYLISFSLLQRSLLLELQNFFFIAFNSKLPFFTFDSMTFKTPQNVIETK